MDKQMAKCLGEKAKKKKTHSFVRFQRKFTVKTREHQRWISERTKTDHKNQTNLYLTHFICFFLFLLLLHLSTHCNVSSCVCDWNTDMDLVLFIFRIFCFKTHKNVYFGCFFFIFYFRWTNGARTMMSWNGKRKCVTCVRVLNK